MKKQAWLILLVASFLFAVGFKAEDWKTYTYDHGHCSVMFPGEPVNGGDKPMMTGNTIHTWVYKNKEEKAAFIFSYTEPMAFPGAADDVLEGSKNGMTKDADEMHVIRKDYKASIPSIEFSYKKDGLHYYAKSYVAHKKLIQLVHGCSKSSGEADGIKFTNSFRYK